MHSMPYTSISKPLRSSTSSQPRQIITSGFLYSTEQSMSQKVKLILKQSSCRWSKGTVSTTHTYVPFCYLSPWCCFYAAAEEVLILLLCPLQGHVELPTWSHCQNIILHLKNVLKDRIMRRVQARKVLSTSLVDLRTRPMNDLCPPGVSNMAGKGMRCEKEVWGKDGCGEPIHRFTIQAGSCTARIISYGAIVVSPCPSPDTSERVCL